MHAQNCLFRALECPNRALSDLDKLMEALFFNAAAAWLKSRSAQHGALVGRRIGASFGTVTGRRHGRLVGGAGTIAGAEKIKLISFADVPPAGLVRTKPRCTLQDHDVAIEVAQHFEKIVVKSVVGEVWFRRD